TQFQATGAMTSADSLLLAASTRRTASVTGQRFTSPATTFIIAGFARAKGFGDYGNCRASQAAFTSGRLERAKANRIMRAQKSPRQWKQLRWKRRRSQRPRLQRHSARAVSKRD